MDKIKVYLGDSQVIFREGMHAVLEMEPDLEIIGEGTTAEEALALVKEQPVNVMVLSENMDSIATRIEELRSCGIVFIGGAPVEWQFESGNPLFLTRDVEPEVLVAAVKTASRKAQKKTEPVELSPSVRDYLISLVEKL